jgi:alkylation response protein AidB-like acyl-CoA dehydrogenase
MLKIDIQPEQRMLAESALRYMSDAYGFETRQKIVAASEPVDLAQWQAYARMGWLGLPFPEWAGGGEGTALDVFLLMQAFGRALAAEPYLGTVVMSGAALGAEGLKGFAREVMPRIVTGEFLVACAFAEPQSGANLDDIGTSATLAGDQFVLRGDKAVVLGAPSAHLFIVSSRIQGPGVEPVPALFAVEPGAQGVELRSYRTLDGRRASEVRLRDVRVSRSGLICSGAEATSAIRRAEVQGTVALLGEAIGCLEGAVDTTIAYLNTREQFGQKLSKFQALRHRVADLFIAKEEAKALCLLAAQNVASGDPRMSEAISAAKAYVGHAGRRICEDAVQLHGAIAITDEYIVGHYLKRLLVIDRLFGDADHHLGRYLEHRGEFHDNPSLPSKAVS